MAAENLKSEVITGRDSTPPAVVESNPGQVFRAYGKIEAAGGDAGSTYRFCQVPSNARCISVFFASDDLSGSGATMDIGLYQTPANGSAVVDADFFASAVDVATAAVALTNVSVERSAALIDEWCKPLWERLSLTSDPGRYYDVTGVSGVAAATGTMLVYVDYVI